ncbi:toxin-antitoxin system HicB family antitoxin [Phormidesmis priestleyi ULC007]|uniref:Toxin-antitoxin system HicB family antitoxin n=1 Tax=Phormidesmis priestleyi ULC007 TaxID=1920490 RepID=A0A2T1DCP5_9CYAN|nr:CopG family transcriptional regulator [Phormidesmis priestleyi]PSB18211.1 toxin-antitoxin system HicB family antitoxin [Phormidesmis priestleyi ULC007]PZO49482.1 MAG: toxin-antitoxin system HicB family antitoxin [Phormidesmis priestleyi]
MSSLQVQLSDSLYKDLQVVSQRQGISVDQWVAIAIAEKMAALMGVDYLEERAKRGSRANYEAALAQVPDIEPEAHDRLPR